MGNHKYTKLVNYDSNLEFCFQQLKQCFELASQLRDRLEKENQQARSQLQLLNQDPEIPTEEERTLLLQDHQRLCADLREFIRDFEAKYVVKAQNNVGDEFKNLKENLVAGDLSLLGIIHQDSFFYALHRCLWSIISVLLAPSGSELFNYLSFSLDQVSLFINFQIKPELDRNLDWLGILLESLLELPTKIKDYAGEIGADDKKALMAFSEKLTVLIDHILNRRMSPQYFEKEVEKYVDGLKLSSFALKNVWELSNHATKSVLDQPFDGNDYSHGYSDLKSIIERAQIAQQLISGFEKHCSQDRTEEYNCWKKELAHIERGKWASDMLEKDSQRKQMMKDDALRACFHIMHLSPTELSFNVLRNKISTISGKETKEKYLATLMNIEERYDVLNVENHELSTLRCKKISEVNSFFDNPVDVAQNFIQNSDVSLERKKEFGRDLKKFECNCKELKTWKHKKCVMLSKMQAHKARIDQAQANVNSLKVELKRYDQFDSKALKLLKDKLREAQKLVQQKRSSVGLVNRCLFYNFFQTGAEHTLFFNVQQCTTYSAACQLLHQYFTQHTACRDASITTAVMTQLFSDGFINQRLEQLERLHHDMGCVTVGSITNFPAVTDYANQELQRGNSLFGIHRRSTTGRDLLRVKTLELCKPYVEAETKLEKHCSQRSCGR